jgi:integrase
VRTDLVFTTTNGDARRPDYVTNEWRYVLAKKKLPKVKFHAMRHTHASALIASHGLTASRPRRADDYFECLRTPVRQGGHVGGDRHRQAAGEVGWYRIWYRAALHRNCHSKIPPNSYGNGGIALSSKVPETRYLAL